MIYLQLFITFLKIGAVSFGGGYGMISIIREECLLHGWLTEGELLDFIAVAESTPGPIAVNMATFIGSAQAGIVGALVATLAVVIPAFIIILIIAALLGNIMKYRAVSAVLEGVRPAVTGLIISTAAIMFLGVVFGIDRVDSAFVFDWRSLVIIAILAVAYLLYLLIRKKKISPIILIILSGVLGIVMF